MKLPKLKKRGIMKAVMIGIYGFVALSMVLSTFAYGF